MIELMINHAFIRLNVHFYFTGQTNAEEEWLPGRCEDEIRTLDTSFALVPCMDITSTCTLTNVEPEPWMTS